MDASYYNWRLRVKSTKEPCIRLIQENSMEFLVQCIYLIYTRLMVYAMQILVYSKDYVYYIPLICNMISFF